MSGGQQKSLSLALVFLHSPRLVILDEPTVGTDPVLGNQIWEYLREKCSLGLSVILVTHYISEAAMADHVGMMRNGRMIEEGVSTCFTQGTPQNNPPLLDTQVTLHQVRRHQPGVHIHTHLQRQKHKETSRTERQSTGSQHEIISK